MATSPAELKTIIENDNLELLQKTLEIGIHFDINCYFVIKEWKNKVEKMSYEKIDEGHEKKGFLHIAIDKGNLELISLLLSFEEINLNLPYDFYSYFYESEGGFFGGAGIPESKSTNLKLTPVEYALYHDKVDIALLLLQHGSEISPRKLPAKKLLLLLNKMDDAKLESYQDQLINIIDSFFSPKVINNNLKKDKEMDQLTNQLDNKLTLTEKNKIESTINSKDSQKNITPKKIQEKREGKIVSLYEFADKQEAKKYEFKWQQEVCDKFFKIGKQLKEGKKSYDLYQQIISQINENQNSHPIKLDSVCRRSFIIALTKVLSERKEIPNLIFQVGITQIQFEQSDPDSKVRQIGNFKMKIPALEYDIAYGENAYKTISYMLKPKSEQGNNNRIKRREALIKLIKNKLKTIKSFKHDDFDTYGFIYHVSTPTAKNGKNNSSQKEKILKNVHFLNGLMMLTTVVEVVVRLYRDNQGNCFDYNNDKATKSDLFPIAIAQARSLFLLLNGKITFDDFIGSSKTLKKVKPNYNNEQHRAYYGVSTGKKTIDFIEIMIEKMEAINDKYTECVTKSSLSKDQNLISLQNSSDSYIIEGKSSMYFDLKSCYGDGSESSSDSSGYSDNELEQENTNFKSKTFNKN